jgi:N-acetyl-gamma-glutamyl-phosphate reductase
MEHRDDGGGHSPVRNHKSPPSIPCTAEAVRDAGLAVVFLATPPEVSMELAGPMLDAGARVVDLSGAFRLRTPENYTAWYKEAHTRPDLLAEAVYGLPEFCRAAIPGARLVANPGCYPTAANLAIRPLLEAGVVDRAAGIVCDAKSGVSGAGRKPRLKTSFCEVTENFSAYSMLRHRHVPEVLQISGLEEREFSFHGAASAARSRHSGDHLFPRHGRRERRRTGADLRKAVRRRGLRPALSTPPHARPARRGAHQLLRYRVTFDAARPGAQWW